jgi:hypothetical protein
VTRELAFDLIGVEIGFALAVVVVLLLLARSRRCNALQISRPPPVVRRAAVSSAATQPHPSAPPRMR